MIYTNILRFRQTRYARWALSLVAVSVALYATQGGRVRPGGGTWQGYVLGTIGALLIVWLTLLGVRKRRYRSTVGTVEGWTSAHVWLGLALLPVATLHCAGLFGWNVHTLAYALMCLVIASGIVGLYGYLSIPRRLAANSGGASRKALFAELFSLDGEGRELARRCEPQVAEAVRSSIERTSLGGGVLRQLMAIDRSHYVQSDEAADGTATASVAMNPDQQPVIDLVAQRVSHGAKRAEVASLQALIVLLSRRQAVLRRIRRDIQLQAWLNLWLYIHVPLTMALIVALLVHILVTFMYW
jgi:hypothetical protein